ncbi:AAA family ATPase [Pseudodesulfovibrio cashew]|uniref:AAA family ATPase n=1 Tax=Pseudodesulfovibrio cashew TaxID=2678688 RepID=A0A6I6JGX8_9BACT|nr:AAA family ATPase [Pseudodesulfovibrio cashew]QGY39622.1 AAA family ATPase [Pseudodesulfovibrio cashew]
MITRIVLKDFMAHADTELELGPGINALTGPNNTGKSAIVEALRCVATNPIPRHYIRHGAKEARVTVELEDGTRIVWVRKKRSSGYELWAPGAEEPVEYWKFGRKPPEDVLAALRLDLVELEGENKDPVDVHVGNQRDPVFLLNQPKSDAAAFFAASTESAHLLAMQNLLKRKTQDAKRRERELQARLTAIETEMERFSLLPDIALHLETARELESTAKELQVAVPALEATLADHVTLTVEHAGLVRCKGVLDTITDVPKLNDVGGLTELLSQLEGTGAFLNGAARISATLAVLADPPEVHDTPLLARFHKELQDIEAALNLARKQAETGRALLPPPVPDETAQLVAILDEIIAHTYRSRRETRRRETLRSVAEPPALADCEPLQGVVAELDGITGQCREAQDRLAGLETELETLEKHIRHRLDELGRCPTCGGELNSLGFLERRHGHDA